MKTEKWLSKKIREALEKENVWAQSFEYSRNYSVPDLYCVHARRASFWLELKVVRTSSCKIPFRRGQRQWIRDHAEAGGTAMVLVWDEKEQGLTIIGDWLVGEAKLNAVKDFRNYGAMTYWHFGLAARMIAGLALHGGNYSKWRKATS